MCSASTLIYLFFIDIFFFFKQKTAYDMRISDWSSDVCSSDLPAGVDIFYPEYKAPAVRARQIMRQHRRQRMAQMQPPGGRRRETGDCNWSLTHDSSPCCHADVTWFRQ